MLRLAVRLNKGCKLLLYSKKLVSTVWKVLSRFEFRCFCISLKVKLDIKEAEMAIDYGCPFKILKISSFSRTVKSFFRSDSWEISFRSDLLNFLGLFYIKSCKLSVLFSRFSCK